MEKNQGFGVPKVAKTGNFGKKSPVAGGIDYVRYLSMQKVNSHDLKSVQVILQFYSALFFDNGCTIHQHFVVEIQIFQLLLQWHNHSSIP